MEIAIFGAGIAGLMTAIALHAHGCRCRIYERLRDGYESGMGFILMPEGLACLQKFGVHITGALLHHYCCRDEKGRILHEEAMPAGARAIRRRDLIAALVRALPEQDVLIFDAELENLAFDEGGRVTSARLNSSKGPLQLQADLYVGADGHRSRARQAMFPDWPEPPAEVFEIVGLARCYNTNRWTGNDFNKFHGHTGGLALGVLPVDADHVVWYLQFDAKRFPLPDELPDAAANAERRRAFVENLAGHWADPIRHLFTITDFSRVHVWRPIDANLAPHFHRANLVLVGDAAHPLLPFTSQGVSSAIADAVTLAKNLTAYRVDSADGYLQTDLAQALSAYSNERRGQCAPYVAKGRELTRHFLSRRVASHTWLPLAQ
jgi:2-polyprenyl-6-methoxyphenol hydroxylase-like FAD-dependent oxidoreductase